MAGGKGPRTTGKGFEYQVAKKIGGERAGYGNCSTMPDVISETLDVECKVAAPPVFLEKALQTVKARSKGNKLQAVVLKENGAGWETARIYMRFNDFRDWYI